MGHRVGVDIGGTFTDFCAFDEQTLAIRTLKVLSTPDDPGAEVLHGIEELRRRYGIAPAAITYFTHGTTVGVNTVIARKGIRLCLFTTENFVDVLEVARLKMPDPYDLHSSRPEPLISKDRVIPIRERMRSDGKVDTPVNEQSVTDALEQVRLLQGEGVVIAFINAYRNGAHEREVKALLARLAPDLPVYCSCEVWSIIREYERTTTAVIHGYVQPRVSAYLASLQSALADAGVVPQPMVTKSNGGVMSAELGKRHCAQMILSGTAAGVIGAARVADASGFPDTMSLDIGGTSADVAFIRAGQPQYGVGELIGEFPIFIPSVAVTSIGAGGGSIAWVDDLGVLRVGPESAGSTPGPACYARGGERPTITDAMVVLGYIGQRELGYSAIETDAERARTAISTVADRIGRDLKSTAQAIIDVAVSSMYVEVSKLMSRYGADPQQLALQAFGGAGPMLASFLARELGMSHIVIPPTPGVLSALGGLVADIKNDFIATVFLDLEQAAAEPVRAGFDRLQRTALTWLHDEQEHHGDHHLLFSADMRYRGQSFEIETALDGSDIAAGRLDAITEAFHREHQRVYEHADRNADVQIINLRLVVVGTSVKPEFTATDFTATVPAPVTATAPVFVDGEERTVAVFERDALVPGMTFIGPAIIAQDDCTTCVLPGTHGTVDRFRNLVLSLPPSPSPQ